MFRQLSIAHWKPSSLNSFCHSCGMLLGIASCIWLTGCSQTQLPSIWQGRPAKEVTLDWQVNRVKEPGTFKISGQTDLPDHTQLTVAALRYLYPASATNRQSNPNPTYAILDYQSVTVEQGTWQTNLNLWQPTSDGSLQENWQLDQQSLAMRFNASPEVVFLVTLTPIDQFTPLQQQLAAKGQKFASTMIRSTAGDVYAQSHQTLTVALPSSEITAAHSQQTENFGWGQRYLIPQEPQNPTQLERPSERQTDAPARAESFLR